MNEPPTDEPVLVAVANPDHVEQLVRTASDLARAAGVGVRIVSVVAKPHGSPFSIYSDETIVEQYAHDTQAVLEAAIAVAPGDVPVEREVVVDRSVADGVLSEVRRVEPRALVIGWHERSSRTDALLGTNLDRLIERVPCDLYVERIGYEADGVDSVLVPVAGGPHVGPAAAAAKAIAARNDATVSVLSVADPDGEDGTDHEGAADEAIEEAVEHVETAPGPDVRIETRLERGDDVSAVLVEAAADHDVVVFGVTRRSGIHRRLVGSIPQVVLPRIDETVLLSRAGDAVGRPRLRRLARFWRRP
ncbi:universal stress protein [Saliphagus sp. LR7]|uniref:universal stress protein n=1 Tax=Saliphagus sp. LR7 TaxID=2282654 RepID=UPI0018E58CBD|nr:universal stress protein [Saliphagus sp. LR7]